jgi:hypothetical protein
MFEDVAQALREIEPPGQEPWYARVDIYLAAKNGIWPPRSLGIL